MKSSLLIILIAGVVGLSGCAVKPMTPQEKEFLQAQNSCTTQANEMVGGPGSGWGSQAQWSSYFEWCMENMGYTKDDLRKWSY